MNKSIHAVFFMVITIFLSTEQLRAKMNTYSLKQCINYARENSTTIDRADNAIKSNHSSLAQSKSALLPNLFLSVSPNAGTTTRWSGSKDLSQKNSSSDIALSAALNSSVTLFQGGKLKKTIVQNKFKLEASQADKQAEEELLGITVLSSYVNVLLAKEQAKNCGVQLKSTEKQLEFARVRSIAGVISKADYLNIKSQFAADKVDLVVAENNLRLNMITLMQGMNMPVNDSFDILVPEVQSIVDGAEKINAEKLYNRALSIRPQIKRTELDLKSGNTGIDISKSELWPSLSLAGTVRGGTGYTIPGIQSDEGVAASISPSIELSLSLPIYQQGVVKNRITQARITADNVKLALNDVKNNLRKEIEQTCLNLKAANVRYEATLELYKSENESYRMAEEMFGQGLINSVNYLISKNNVTAVENDLTQAKYQIVLQIKYVEYYRGQPVTL